MKTILVLLMPILFGNVTVEALRCYACVGINSNAQCNQQEEYCFFQVGVKTISKGCTTSLDCISASSNNINLGVLMGSQVSCCQTDLCNVNGSSVSGLNFLLLSLSFLISGLVLSL
ncbi:lymphocyte antigen 6E isoform X2 [Salmo salar]|uniref:Lymphocyte antigen 6E isoform X2 n=1 Tax=Salmo salar TaxID=8030 RepID=A0A1S3Q3R6_SALSA|nr:lymphocyte antigen 6E isoform X2 [Salmo salar]